MTTFFSVSNQQELHNEMAQKIGTDRYCDGFESYIKVHPRIGKGEIYLFQFNSGLELRIHEYLLQEPTILGAEFKYFCLSLCWVICGHSNYTLQNWDFALQPQQNIFSYGNDISGAVKMNAGHKIVFVELGLEKYFAQPMSINQQDQLPIHLRKSIHANKTGAFWQNNLTTPEMNVVLHQILNCPYQGFTKKIYLESKAIELLALGIHNLERNSFEETNKYKPKKDEIDRLHYAKEILFSNLQKPPTLNSLAKQVCLNEYKLKQGFRFIFGTTVFGYLHDHRMAQARLLLASGTMNVTEVAQAVGYTNLSHFAAAFRKKYGVNPSVFKEDS
ncbi:MAG: AraC family transcriptional regulator [Cyanobacteria bacterium P01_D01_bin.6]